MGGFPARYYPTASGGGAKEDAELATECRELVLLTDRLLRRGFLGRVMAAGSTTLDMGSTRGTMTKQCRT